MSGASRASLEVYSTCAAASCHWLFVEPIAMVLSGENQIPAQIVHTIDYDWI